MAEKRPQSSEERIKTLEALLQRTYAAHPQLIQWAFHERCITGTGRTALSTVSDNTSNASSDQSHRIAKLKHNRDKWRDRAYKLKDMCKQLHLRVQQDNSPDHTGNLLPAADIGISHTKTRPLSKQELQDLKDELVATAPATAARRQASLATQADQVPIMTIPGLHRIRTSTEQHVGVNASPCGQGSSEIGTFPAAMGQSGTLITPMSGKTAYKSALKKDTAGMSTRKKGVSLHESQNITHEFEDEAAIAKQKERVPSIMDMLQSGGSPPNAVQMPSLMEILQQQERQEATRQAQEQAKQEAQPQQQASDKLFPCILALKTSLDSDGNTQLSLSIDDATKDVLTGLLKMASTDELKSTPPLDFFAAAGLLDSFTYTPTDPKTPSYFKVDKTAWESDEQSNQFARTGRIATPQDDDEDATDAGVQNCIATCTDDSRAPCEVIGFACYDDSPKTSGSAMDMIQHNLAQSYSDVANRIFGSTALAVEPDSDEETSNLLHRMFSSGGAASSSDDGCEAAGAAMLEHVFGDGAVEERASEAMMDSMADRIFGPSTQVPVLDCGEIESPSVKDRVASFEEMFGSEDLQQTGDQDGLEFDRVALTGFILGVVQPQAAPPHQCLTDDLENAREMLTRRLFGDAGPSACKVGANDLMDESNRERATLTHRSDVHTVDDEDERARLALTERMFGGQADAEDALNPGTGDHHVALEQSMFGVSTSAKAVSAKVFAAGVAEGHTVAGANKWLQHEETAALHSTRIRASSWIKDSSPGAPGDNTGDACDQLLQLNDRGKNAGQVHWPGGHAAMSVLPYGI